MRIFLRGWLSIASVGALTLGGLYYGPSRALASANQHLEQFQFDSFGDLRHYLTSQISRASTRVWLYTDYLTDGELVTALYIAKYRGADVSVLLERPKAHAYMSRLRDLRKQNIPVFLAPQLMSSDWASALIVDEEVFFINASLDFMKKNLQFLVQKNGPEARDFRTGFLSATERNIVPNPRPLPLVGRPRNKPSRIYSPGRDSQVDPKVSKGAYKYSLDQRSAPEEITTKLPQKPVYLKRQDPIRQTPDQPENSETTGNSQEDVWDRNELIKTQRVPNDWKDGPE